MSVSRIKVYDCWRSEFVSDNKETPSLESAAGFLFV